VEPVHCVVVVAVRITWILDGLEVSVARSLTGKPRASAALPGAKTGTGVAQVRFFVYS
jgi:hypothetical protein